jgi:hypothetical protein
MGNWAPASASHTAWPGASGSRERHTVTMSYCKPGFPNWWPGFGDFILAKRMLDIKDCKNTKSAPSDLYFENVNQYSHA